MGWLPFIYLGVRIFKGKPRRTYLQPIADRIKVKLSSWKGSLLSVMGRIQLVKSVIHGMLFNSFHVYAWPVSLLKTVDTWLRNFIWSGDIDARKIVTIAWRKVCSPALVQGLGVRSIRQMNEVAPLRLCWNLLSSRSQWASFLKARFFGKHDPRSSFLGSSIWPAVHGFIGTVLDNSVWQLGDGRSIKFWTDNWLSNPIVDMLQIPSQLHKELSSQVCDFMLHYSWNLPLLAESWPSLADSISDVVIPQSAGPDRLRWLHSDGGDMSFKDASNFFSSPLQETSWAMLVWSSVVPPSKSFLFWQLLH